MQNKRHNIMDDAWEMKEEMMGGPEHTMRVGLVTNTVMNAMPVVIDDIMDIVIEKPEFDYTTIGTELGVPVLLNWQYGDTQVAVLVVHDKDSLNVQCYPFNNLNEEKRWWLYEMAFDMTPSGFIEVRPVHPLLEEAEFEPTQEMMDHLEVLATVIGSFLQRLQSGEITVEEESTDFSKINKKRIKSKREPIANDWKVVYVGKQDS